MPVTNPYTAMCDAAWQLRTRGEGGLGSAGSHPMPAAEAPPNLAVQGRLPQAPCHSLTAFSGAGSHGPATSTARPPHSRTGFTTRVFVLSHKPEVPWTSQKPVKIQCNESEELYYAMLKTITKFTGFLSIEETNKLTGDRNDLLLSTLYMLS